MSHFRSVNSLRADEIFGAVTQVSRAEESGLPFPFSGRRAPTEREVALANAKADAAAKAKAKAAAKDKAAALSRAESKTESKANGGRGTPEFGKEEALKSLS
jgi:hypothetical protein